jgi:Lrp/AsnC family transcriptional regulator for asnA, asnC and gidA
MGKIEELDKKILKVISQNARISFRDVAEICEVSRAAVHQHIQKMMKLKLIVSSSYQIDPQLLGYSTCAFIGVKLERGSMYKDVFPELEKNS